MDQSVPEEERTGQQAPAESVPAGEAARVGPFVWLRKNWRSLVLLLAIVGAAGTLVARRWSLLFGDQSAANALLAEQKKKKATDGPKDPFTFGAFSVRPSETDRVESGIKPGHWTTGALELRANFDDFRGQLATEMVGTNGQPVDLDGLRYQLRSVRPSVLPKSQKKVLDVALYSPIENFSRQTALRLLTSGGRDLWSARELLTPLSDEQFFLVVLARNPNEYGYLKYLDTTWAPRGTIEDRGGQAHYRVLLPAVTSAVPLPNRALFWTATAALLWDDLDPNLLNSAQQQALVDWLHWGGQLIVSGPDSLDALRGSFLEEFLPAAPGASWELTSETLSTLERLSPDNQRPLRVVQPWTGQQLTVDERVANVLAMTEDNQPLIVERRVGRGRTVVTAFRLSQRDLVNWPGYDAVFNAALLRRPRRWFVRSPELKVGVIWADRAPPDPARVSQLNFFSRDAGNERPKTTTRDAETALRMRQKELDVGLNTGIDPFGEEQTLKAMTGTGVAAWSDQSPVSQEARNALRSASRIQVPSASFVLYVLGAYVVILVPINWLLCRTLGRVEMAWVLALFVALAFSILVVRLAQLDIGFDRSTTEIDLVEVQGKYRRGHVTRYCQLYTSLGTSYSVEMSNPDAVALPMRTGSDPVARQSRATVTLRQLADVGPEGGPAVRLENIEIASNSAEMVHAEEIYDLGGALECVPTDEPRTYRLRNGTALHWRDAVVVFDNEEATLGDLAPGEERVFSLAKTNRPEGFSQNRAKVVASRSQVETTGKENPAEPPDLQALGDLAIEGRLPGELRLVAWSDEELPGMSIEPTGSQTRRAALLVAHLSYGPAAPLEIDFNSRAQIMATLPENDRSDDFMNPGGPEATENNGAK